MEEGHGACMLLIITYSVWHQQKGCSFHYSSWLNLAQNYCTHVLRKSGYKLSYNVHDCALYTCHMTKLYDIYLVFVWDWHSEGPSVLPDHWSQLVQVGDERTTTIFKRNIHADNDDLYQLKINMTTLYQMIRTCTTGTHCCLEGPLSWLQSIQTRE